MERHAPAAAADAYRRAAQAARLPQASARASVRSTWKAGRCSSWRAGRPRLRPPTWKRCGAYTSNRCGTLIGAQADPGRATPRPPHERVAPSQSWPACSWRCDGSRGGRRTCAVAGPLRGLPAQPGSLRGCPWMGGASPPKLRRLISWTRRPRRTWYWTPWRWSGGPEGEQHAETALHIFEQLGDLSGQAHALNNLALRPLVEGRWPDALPMFARAAESFRRVGDASNAANADYNRADVLVRQGRSDEALPLLQNTLRVARAVGDEELVALVLKEQGARSRSGDVQTGLLLLQEARAQLAKLREPQEVVDADIASAEAHLLGGSPEGRLPSSGERCLTPPPSTLPLCCRRRTVCKPPPSLPWVKSYKLRRLWPRACSKARHPMLRTSGVSCLQSPPE